VAEGNWTWEHGEKVEGAGGEVDEHCGVNAELGDMTSGLSGERRHLALTEPQWLRAAEQSGCGVCAWTRKAETATNVLGKHPKVAEKKGAMLAKISVSHTSANQNDHPVQTFCW
jgi:hypothetical protein